MQIDLCTYNIRGLNKKQAFVKDFLEFNKLNFIVLLETHVQETNAQSIAKFIGPKFDWIFNYMHHSNGRIWIGFNPLFWKVHLISSSAQHSTCSVLSVNTGHQFTASFVYALHTTVSRRNLWMDLFAVKSQLSANAPWCISGDFNICLGPSETSNGNHWTSGMLEFNDFVSNNGLSDLRISGPQFTWWDSNINAPVFKKLDRCLVNGDWLCQYSNAHAYILQRGISDHCPIGISFGWTSVIIPKPFLFFNHFIKHASFHETVSNAWNITVIGNPWFTLTQKLKSTKTALRSLNFSNGNVHNNLLAARQELSNFQMNISSPPSNSELLWEKSLIENFQNALLEEETLLKQKSRVNWLKCGDSNSKFFFNACKGRWNSNKILSLLDGNGNSVSSHKDIAAVAVNYYSDMLGQAHSVTDFPENLSLPCISSSQALDMQLPFCSADIYATLKSMAKGKSPGPDGFTVEFYLAAWDIVGDDVCKAILFFFSNNSLPRIINSSALTLVPKCQSPESITDFRPIACCNILYKCISKMLAGRIKQIIVSVISPSQSAFVPGRKIGDNILLAQALFKDYHLPTGPSRCAFKIDLKKAFDTLSWSFIARMLDVFGFPDRLRSWIMTCITGSMLSVKVNGALEGYFAAGSGLRQGDPISPYIFVMAMEVFSAFLNKHTIGSDFKHHWRTKDLNITHINFADDILLFCHGDPRSVDILLAGLAEFSSCSGMHINPSKCQYFTAATCDATRRHIEHSTGFTAGNIPFVYLGLPLISSKLTFRHCLPLIMKIRRKIDSWQNICLNHSGRLQLIKSVLFGIHGYWSSNLLLPKAALKKIQSLLIMFLWGGSSDNTKLVKVSWKDCCFPKDEGGLGLYDLSTRNNAAFLFHLWRITQPANDSLWITWFKRIYLKRRAFWTMNIPSKSSWCIRKILNLRPLALRFMNYRVGSSSEFLLWHDPWVDHKPLLHSCHLSTISLAGSSLMAPVNSLIVNSLWQLPTSNHLFVMDLRQKILGTPILARDSISWLDFSTLQTNIATIWNSIRDSSTPPAWIHAVWHSFSIPKCAFTFWLALKGRLLTKDRMQRFHMDTNLSCILCNRAIETHDHIFGSCPFISEILSTTSFKFHGVWDGYLLGRFFLDNSKGIRKQIGLLFLSVVIFLTWKERNDRIHNLHHSLPAVAISSVAKTMVRERLHHNKQFQRAYRKDNSVIVDLY